MTSTKNTSLPPHAPQHLQMAKTESTPLPTTISKARCPKIIKGETAEVKVSILNQSKTEQLSDQLRNISNIISNPHNQIPIQKNSPMNDVPHRVSEKELQKISGEHDKLVNNILEEEEEIIASHKQNIDEIVETVKKVYCLNF